MTVADPQPVVAGLTAPLSTLIADVCMRAYLAFDGEPALVEHDLGDGTSLVGFAFSLNRVVTVTYEILSNRMAER